MKNKKVTVVMLCGGAGTRLWPLSRAGMPKQFLSLIGKESLFEQTIKRFKNKSSFNKKIISVAGHEHRFIIAEYLSKNKISGDVILEPIQRNTAAAVAYATLLSSPNEILLFCPSDHYMPDNQYFNDLIKTVIPFVNEENIITFGIKPTYPSTEYGYIKVNKFSHEKTIFHAKNFVEKPSIEKAKKIYKNYFWNAGIFLGSRESFSNALKQYNKKTFNLCNSALLKSKNENFDGVKFIRPEKNLVKKIIPESFDNSVMEKHKSIKLVAYNSDWSDVGNWSSLYRLQKKDKNNNYFNNKNIISKDSYNLYVHSSGRHISAIGLDKLVIIDTQDSLLISSNKKMDIVKNHVKEVLSKDNKLSQNKKILRPWGSYDNLDAGENFLVKRITVKPFSSLSLQSHKYRSEHWVVVKGEAKVISGNKEIILKKNQSTYIPKKTKHRLINERETLLEIIEVQSGEVISEDDIIRYEDKYGR